jgi:hypothetical protein
MTAAAGSRTILASACGFGCSAGSAGSFFRFCEGAIYTKLLTDPLNNHS